jgi:hypothetical protein
MDNAKLRANEDNAWCAILTASYFVQRVFPSGAIPHGELPELQGTVKAA